MWQAAWLPWAAPGTVAGRLAAVGRVTGSVAGRLAAVGRVTGSVAGRVRSITFACDVGKSELCAGGTLEWSCAKHCPVGATACQMMLRAAGLTGTIPSAIADLSCASLLTVVCAPSRASGRGTRPHIRPRPIPYRADLV